MSTSTLAAERATSLRGRAWELVDVAKPGDTASRRIDAFLLSLILLNVIAVIVETVPEVASRYATIFQFFEIFSVTVFIFEYVIRVWACVEDPRYAKPVTGRLRFLVQPMSIVDLLAILPALLSFGLVDLRVLRGLRLFRLFRVAKATRYVAALLLFGTVLRTRREELILTTALMLVLLVFGASIMYFAESEAQPDKFSSIPASMWWAVATLTTVGYGDVFPVTPLGKVAAAIVAILGIGFFALPTAIIGSGFLEAIQQRREPKCCPNCGHALD
jgi:voltage-gated potassium channel